MRIIRLVILPCVIAIICPSAQAQASKIASRHHLTVDVRTPKTLTPDIRYIDVGGFKLRMKIAGAGTPTIVLDAGFGDRIENWDDIFAEVARFSRVVAYDRAGLGKSDPGPEPRTFTRIATELHTLLQRANIPPPYVLVGHSMGGANIRAFASLFKNDVAGLVFIDPATEQILNVLSAKERDAEFERQEAALKDAPPGVRAEWRLLKEGTLNKFSELQSFGTPPDVPTMVLVATRNRPPHWAKSVLDQYGSWVADEKEGGLVLTADSGHYIQRDEPALVLSAIKRVLFPSVQNALSRAVTDKGVHQAIAQYREMRQRYPMEYFSERILNTLGYEQLRAKHIPEAIALFQLNVEVYPKAFNTYDSLAEAYAAKGDREAAIKNYRKSLSLNPDNTNAVESLKKLGAAR